eukprot:m.269527 g.269527  ORF g.269527 m.269527 type:complete len:58 (-) comp19734_c0_seq70:86-259(-)
MIYVPARRNACLNASDAVCNRDVVNQQQVALSLFLEDLRQQPQGSNKGKKNPHMIEI